MTNQEAIGILAHVVETAKGRCFVADEAISDAYNMAIKALETHTHRATCASTIRHLGMVSRVVVVQQNRIRRIHGTC